MSIRLLRHWPLTAWLVVFVCLAGLLIAAGSIGSHTNVQPSPVSPGGLQPCAQKVLAVRDTLVELNASARDPQRLGVAAQRTQAAALAAAAQTTGAVQLLLTQTANTAAGAVGATADVGFQRAQQVFVLVDLAATACVNPNDPLVLDALTADSTTGGSSAPTVPTAPSMPSASSMPSMPTMPTMPTMPSASTKP